VTEPPEPVLPERSKDERDTGWGDSPTDNDDDVRRLLDERPPHHDRDRD
jgi:hypothetical protein